MFGTVLAMILIAVLENGLLLAGAGFYFQQIFLGVLIVVAVAIQMMRVRQRGKY
jgi:predicted ABC-type sugar transport system permease subunit